MAAAAAARDDKMPRDVPPPRTSNRTGNHPAQSQIWTTGRRLRNTGFRDWTWRTARLFRKAGTAHRSCRGNRAWRALGYHPRRRARRVSDCHSRGWGGCRRSDPLRRALGLLADAMAISPLLTVAGASPHSRSSLRRLVGRELLFQPGIFDVVEIGPILALHRLARRPGIEA